MILIIDDDKAVRVSLELLFSREGHGVRAVDSPDAALEVLRTGSISLVVLDMNFSLDTSGKEGLALLKEIRASYLSLPVILITGWATIDLAVEGMKLGAMDFINKPWDNERLLQSVRTLLHLQRKTEDSPDRQRLDRDFDFGHIIGTAPAMLDVLRTVGRVAATDASVLILGESGTGKELIAEALHLNSTRRNKPFCKVNLGGISNSLFESEMFGHVRGAFTDARFDRAGRFETANKGTIFLDEIGELDASSQVKLLRVLQDRTFEVLGSSRPKQVDVRVICATNKNLKQMVAEGSFREDLLYRINLVTLRLPPLRERRDDIPLLVTHFISQLRNLYGQPTISVDRQTMQRLKDLPLPGNIRELKNLVERTVLMAGGSNLRWDDFQAQTDSDPVGGGTRIKEEPAGAATLEEMEVKMIKRAMEVHQGRITKAARSLGITRNALYRRLEKYNLPYHEERD